MSNQKGKFIVLYGINNLGKSTQAKLLVERIKRIGQEAEYLKYPIYDLKPSGPMINSYLRQNNPHHLNPREAQILYAENRYQFEPLLKAKLEAGINIVAEDYTGTGIAWGLGNGVGEDFLKEINAELLQEDLAFLFDGERFLEAREKNHVHETNDDLTNRTRWAHLKLREEYNWIKIEANLSISQIHEQIWQEVNKLLNPQIEYHPNHLLLDYIEVDKPTKTEKIEGKKEEKRIIKVERIRTNAKMPTKAYAGDAGFDLYSAECCSLLPGVRVVIKTGLKIAIPNGYVGLVWDKSSTAKDGLHTLAGVVDSGFRGELSIIVINLGYDLYHISPGQKIAQLIIQEAPEFELKEDKVDNDTERNDKMLGSSGKF